MSHSTTDGLVGHYLAEEIDAAYLYRELAAVEADVKRRDLFERLATVEDKHIERWEQVLAEQGGQAGERVPSFRARLVAWVARRLGPGAVLPMILAEEGREVAAYLRLAKQATDHSTSDAARTLAADSAVHARELSEVLGRGAGEPWHSTEAGGYLRSVVYGFNDGLTANFGLLAGVIGASVAPHIVVISGITGAMADALSMGASGYLAAKSEAEVHAHDIEMERNEILLMPEIEQEELALIYEAKGLPIEQARSTASALMADPAQALAIKVREELDITESRVTPLRDGLVTGVATLIGAIIPILPFLFVSTTWAVWISLTISMAAHFGVGAARSVFTGRGLWASGRDMFLVGFGVAAAGYIIGLVLEQVMGGPPLAPVPLPA